MGKRGKVQIVLKANFSEQNSKINVAVRMLLFNSGPRRETRYGARGIGDKNIQPHKFGITGIVIRLCKTLMLSW
jgi:hypothetical protein